MLLALLLACASPEAAPAPVSPPAVVVGPEDYAVATTRRILAGPRVAGTLEPAGRAVLRAEVAGEVEAVSAELGERVTAGQVLARVEATTARQTEASAVAGLASARQDLAVTERELERVGRLVEGGALASRDRELSESAVTAARARVNAAEAQLGGARQQLAATTVRAPIAGIIGQRSVSQGDIVAPGAPLFTVIDPRSLRIEGAVPADAVGLLKPGTAVVFEVQGYAGRSFEGSVERVAPAVDPATRQIPILVSLPNPEGTLVAGLFAEGRVATEAHEGIVVPADALDDAPEGATVVRVKDGKAARVGVQIGIRDEDAEQVEITSGLEVGDLVLVGAARSTADGVAVTVRGGEG